MTFSLSYIHGKKHELLCIKISLPNLRKIHVLCVIYCKINHCYTKKVIFFPVCVAIKNLMPCHVVVLMSCLEYR